MHVDQSICYGLQQYVRAHIIMHTLDEQGLTTGERTRTLELEGFTYIMLPYKIVSNEERSL